MDLSKFDKYTLIKALWDNTRMNNEFINQSPKKVQSRLIPSKPTNADIDRALGSDNYIDYLNGSCIKTDFTDMGKVDPYSYNKRCPSKIPFEGVVSRL